MTGADRENGQQHRADNQEPVRAQDTYYREEREKQNITDPRLIGETRKIKNMCRGFQSIRGSVAPMSTEKHAFGQQEVKVGYQNEKYYGS